MITRDFDTVRSRIPNLCGAWFANMKAGMYAVLVEGPSRRATRSLCWIEARPQPYQAPRHRENSGFLHWQNLIIPGNDSYRDSSRN
jgi:hypothetical protein